MSDPEAAAARTLRVVDGETYADWESLYAGNAVAVYGIVYRQVGNRPDAEDLTAEVFLAALPRLRLPAPVRSVRAYLSATARTVLAEHWRRHYGAPPTVDFVDELGVEDLDDPPTREPAGRALRLLARLPDRFRQILELRFLRGLSVGEAAGVMGVTAGNARVLQHRALRRAAELAEAEDP
jgi:RNA polymerase sigma-70 factor (ECF subfamily)